MIRFRNVCFAVLLSLFLGIRDGYIALWKYGDPTPLQVFPCRVEMLPLADQKALAQGIHISSEQELSQLLEDYLS